MLRVTLISIFTLLNLVIFAQSAILHFPFDEISGTNTALESINEQSLVIANHFNRPERIEAINGTALRLDGYSTFVESNNFQVPSIERKMAIELWYATESFNSQTAALVSQITGSEGFAIKVSPFGVVQLQVHTDDRFFLVQSENRLQKYQWNHILAQIDLDAKTAEVYVNGERWAFRSLNEHEFIDFANTTFYIGRGNDSPEQFGFVQSIANGAIDELRFFSESFTPEEIQARFEAIGLIETELFIDPNTRHPREDDHLRPRYHVMPNTSWTNEAYGLTYYNGKYHLFSQKNPNAPMLFFMHWGHYSSPDLVSWKEEKMALAPEPGFADFGVWSGTTTFDREGKPVISYTGVNGQFAGIGMAFPKDDDLIEWELPEENPVIERRPAGNFEDFRDPYIFLVDSTYYMVVGGGVGNNGGGLLVSYKSNDLLNWQKIPDIFQDTNFQRSGFFWEMPAIFPINEADFLCVVTPLYRGLPAQTVYWIGAFENERFQPYHEAPKPFEHLTRHLLSPAFGQDEAGRWAYIGIIPEDRDVNDQIAAAWRQTFSLPRVVRLLQDTTIGHYPHPNLCRLRGEQTQIQNRIIEPNSSFNLPEIKGQQCELELVLVPSADAKFSLEVLKNESATMLTEVEMDMEVNRLGLNRRKSSPYITKEDLRFSDYVFSDTIRLQVFIDHSILEVFVDNLTVLSARVYPSMAQDLFDLIVENGSVEIVELNFWELGDKEATYAAQTCPPEHLPDRFFTEVSTSSSSIPPTKSIFEVYPNPVKDSVHFRLSDGAKFGNYSIELYTVDGQLIHRQKLNNSETSIPVETSGQLLLGKIIEGEHTVQQFKLVTINQQ